MADLSQVEFNDITYNLKDTEARENISALNQITTYEQKTGSIVSFEASAANVPLKELIVNIEPVQDLHGYSHPWPGGNGKNKYKIELSTTKANGLTFSNNNGVVTVNGTATAAISRSVVNFGYITLPAGTYIFSGNTNTLSDTDGRLVLYRKTTSSYSAIAMVGSDKPEQTVTLNSDIEVVVTIVTSAGKVFSNYKYYPMIRLATEIDDTFEPYSNICPIEGQTKCNLTRTGKNLFDPKWFLNRLAGGLTSKVEANGSIHFTGTSTAATRYAQSSAFLILPPGTYIIKGAPQEVVIRMSGEQIDTNGVFVSDGKTPCHVAVQFVQGQSYDVYETIQLELGSTATDYKPYAGNQISVTFPSEAGTVYGGTLTLNPDRTGTLVVDRAFNECDGSSDETWFKEGSGERSYFRIAIGEKGAVVDDFAISNLYTQGLVTGSINYVGINVINSSAYNVSQIVVRPQNVSAMTLDDFRAQLAITPLQVVYKLASSQTYQLTAEQVSAILTTLYGTNNIWANTGDVTVSYGAYLETIQTHADQLGNSILSAIAPLETTYTASRSYTIGSYLFVGTKFYKVTAAIAEGSTITPDTNVTQTTIAEQLMALAAN